MMRRVLSFFLYGLTLCLGGSSFSYAQIDYNKDGKPDLVLKQDTNGLTSWFVQYGGLAEILDLGTFGPYGVPSKLMKWSTGEGFTRTFLYKDSEQQLFIENEAQNIPIYLGTLSGTKDVLFFGTDIDNDGLGDFARVSARGRKLLWRYHLQPLGQETEKHRIWFGTFRETPFFYRVRGAKDNLALLTLRGRRRFLRVRSARRRRVRKIRISPKILPGDTVRPMPVSNGRDILYFQREGEILQAGMSPRVITRILTIPKNSTALFLRLPNEHNIGFFHNNHVETPDGESLAITVRDSIVESAVSVISINTEFDKEQKEEHKKETENLVITPPPTLTATYTPSPTQTFTHTPTTIPTHTFSPSPTTTVTATATFTATATSTFTATVSATPTPTQTATPTSTPIPYLRASRLSKNATSGQHKCAIDTSGRVVCWGANQYGQVGDGLTSDRTRAVPVAGLENKVMVDVAVGLYHSCAVEDTGALYCWGRNNYGQIGDSTNTDSPSPHSVQSLGANAKEVSAGNNFTCTLLDSDEVKCWGSNYNYQLGIGVTTNQNSPTASVGGLSGTKPGTLVSGQEHSCVVDTLSGAAKCWGQNDQSQLGDSTQTNRGAAIDVNSLSTNVKSITAGGWHACAITHNDAVSCWGANWIGMLGDNSTTRRSTPVSIFGVADGDYSLISAGYQHTCAKTSSGSLECFGSNNLGQLAHPSSVTAYSTPLEATSLGDEPVELRMGRITGCARLSDARVKCWGGNAFGQLGRGLVSLGDAVPDYVLTE